MATQAPTDLLTFRQWVMAETGLSNPVEVGLVGDQEHEERGGYHISGNGINAKGKLSTDYSTKRTRDHFLPNPYCSAVDIGDNWPRGGRAAWIRFNQNVSWELIHHPEAMPTIRAMNYIKVDGGQKLRYDTANASQGEIPSTDTVDIHTHIERWRDAQGTAQGLADLVRLRAHIIAARDDTSIAVALAQLTGGDDMADPTGWDEAKYRIQELVLDEDAQSGGPFRLDNKAKQRQVAAHQEVMAKLNTLSAPTVTPEQLDIIVAALQEGLSGLVSAAVKAELSKTHLAVND